jgi:N-methylhydantoinase A
MRTSGLVGRYFEALEAGCFTASGSTRPCTSCSRTGVISREFGERYPIRMLDRAGRRRPRLERTSASSRQPNLLCFDMGGTTAKACLVSEGRPT